MSDEKIDAVKRWFRDRWELIKFAWTHEHYYICTDEPTGLHGSERWYWHIEKCWCGRRQLCLTNWCDGTEPKN